MEKKIENFIGQAKESGLDFQSAIEDEQLRIKFLDIDGAKDK